jgi:hypothetical protein
VAQDDAAPQWVRAPDQRVYRAPRLCGSDPAGGRGPCGHRGIPAARATLPTRARQKGLVLMLDFLLARPSRWAEGSHRLAAAHQ